MKREFKQLFKYLLTIVVSGSAGVSAGVGEWAAFYFLIISAVLWAVYLSIEPIKLLKK